MDPLRYPSQGWFSTAPLATEQEVCISSQLLGQQHQVESLKSTSSHPSTWSLLLNIYQHTTVYVPRNLCLSLCIVLSSCAIMLYLLFSTTNFFTPKRQDISSFISYPTTVPSMVEGRKGGRKKKKKQKKKNGRKGMRGEKGREEGRKGEEAIITAFFLRM